ncbi:MAG: lysozyme [Lachnospiraceae bacterium]|nr:lysozyme [Lachnospiraceae bacterium]
MEIHEGDLVTLSADAVYYSGQGIRDWVKSDRWIVKSVSGDRIVLGKNESGSHEINSPVSAKFVEIVSEKTERTARIHTADEAIQTAERAAVSAVSAADSREKPQTGTGTEHQGEMAVSVRGVELVAKYEGCRLEAYKCPAGVWTIGYGHTAGVQPGQTLPSREAAKALLEQDLKKYAASVNNCVKKGMIGFPLTQNQFDALTSFCYNCGAGNLQKLVNGRNASEIAEKLMAYTKGGGKVLPGLVRRREEEKALFLS